MTLVGPLWSCGALWDLSVLVLALPSRPFLFNFYFIFIFKCEFGTTPEKIADQIRWVFSFWQGVGWHRLTFATPTSKLRRRLWIMVWDKLTTRRQIHKLSLYHNFNNPKHQTPNYITAMMPETRAHNTGRTLRNANTHTVPPNRTTSYQRPFFSQQANSGTSFTNPLDLFLILPSKQRFQSGWGCPDPGRILTC